MRCPFCGQEHPDTTKFCPETGNKLEKSSLECPSCGRKGIPMGSNFCPNCRFCFNENYANPTGNDAYRDFVVNGVPFRMMRVEGGTFRMGESDEWDEDDLENEIPSHLVTLSSYFIGQTEVTQELWMAVMNDNPSYFKGLKRPVECVSWADCLRFIRKLNIMMEQGFRLPTEAEWEYAARGGKSGGTKFAGSNSIEDIGWYNGNSRCTHDVATKQANALGIYDMSGNVFEWCQDRYGKDYYRNSPYNNPQGPSSGIYRVLRGGCWNFKSEYSRVSYRSFNPPQSIDNTIGFRLAL